MPLLPSRLTHLAFTALLAVPALLLLPWLRQQIAAAGTAAQVAAGGAPAAVDLD